MEIASNSFVGKRESNQDYFGAYFNRSDQIIAILCDGMGGHKGGDVASEMAVTQLGNQWLDTSFTHVEEVKDWLYRKINGESARIFDAGNTYNDLYGMGTTLVLAVSIGEQILFANVGDSRAYLYNNRDIKLITEDHSFANQLYLQGEISQEEFEVHTQKHALTRSLGISNEVEVDFFSISTDTADYVFLCSDGLSNTLSDSDMVLTLMADIPLKEKAQLMVQKAFENGSSDNISIILLDIESLRKGGR